MPTENSIQYWSQPRDVSMSEDWFPIASADHFWMKWRFAELLRRSHLLPGGKAAALEVGCGHGIFLGQLATQFPYTLTGTDLNLKVLESIKLPATLAVYDITTCQAERHASFDLAFAMDVIEHIDDDLAFLKAIAFHVKPAGLVVINVPYAQSLFSRFDALVGHKRRYSKKSLRALMIAAGLKPVSIWTWGFTMLPLLILRKLYVQLLPESQVVKAGLTPPSKVADKLLQKLMQLELNLPFNGPIGTSMLAIARVEK